MNNLRLASPASKEKADAKGKKTVRRIEMTVEREVVTVVRRAGKPRTLSGAGQPPGAAICELCGQPLPATIPALPDRTGGDKDSKADKKLKR
jgi:hypothetical protein